MGYSIKKQKVQLFHKWFGSVWFSTMGYDLNQSALGYSIKNSPQQNVQLYHKCTHWIRFATAFSCSQLARGLTIWLSHEGSIQVVLNPTKSYRSLNRSNSNKIPKQNTFGPVSIPISSFFWLCSEHAGETHHMTACSWRRIMFTYSWGAGNLIFLRGTGHRWE